MSATFTVHIEEECPPCKGTGVYIGMAERDGAAVVCYKCKGTGFHEYDITYKKFEGRKRHPDAKWVYACNPGIVLGSKEGVCKLSDFGGVTYESWLRDGEFPYGSEDRKYICPAWWYQTCNYKLKPDWKECWDTFGSTFSKCRHFGNKDKCWSKWDEEIGGPNNDLR